jgi:hypothetical protein
VILDSYGDFLHAPTQSVTRGVSPRPLRGAPKCLPKRDFAPSSSPRGAAQASGDRRWRCAASCFDSATSGIVRQPSPPGVQKVPQRRSQND